MPTPGYHLDLCAFSLAKLKSQLKTARLLPSQQALGKDIDERFAHLERNGIKNLAQLQEALKTKAGVQAFAKATGLPADYLTLLRREVNGYQPKPVDLQDFPGVKPAVVRKLRQIGIKNTEQLFPNVLTRKSRREFAQQHQIEPQDLLELTKLTDVSRTRWVGPKFARLLIESEYDTVAKIASSEYQELYQSLVRTNEKSGIYKGKFGVDDMRLWVNSVQDVPQVIQY